MSVPENKTKDVPVKTVFMDSPFTNVPGFHIKTDDDVQSTLAVCAVDVCPKEPVGEKDTLRYRYAKKCAEHIVRTLNTAQDLLAALVALKMNSEANEGAGCWCNQRIGGQINFECRNTPYCRNVRAAIAKATGGPS